MRLLLLALIGLLVITLVAVGGYGTIFHGLVVGSLRLARLTIPFTIISHNNKLEGC